MERPLNYLGHGIGLSIAVLYTIAGQAHFTDRVTPDLARNIDQMTHNTHAAFSFLASDFTKFKYVLGLLDLTAAACLWRRQTRFAGLIMAVVGFSGGMYGQMHNNDDVTQVGSFLAVALIGWCSLLVTSG